MYCTILDHGDDPGRYTLITGRGLVVTANENGSVVCQRKCHNPHNLVYELSREPGVRTVGPGKQDQLLSKVQQHLVEKIR